MKKMLLATALALLILGCAQRTFAVQNKPAAMRQRKPSPIIFFVSGIGQRKLSMQPKFVAAQKILLKRNPANIRKWIAQFCTFRHYTPLGKLCVMLTTNCMSCPSIWATLSTLALIYFWVPSGCFFA